MTHAICSWSLLYWTILFILLFGHGSYSSESEEETGKKRRQVFREDVSPLLGGKVPSGAFDWSRLMFNNLDSRGISIPDGFILSNDRHPAEGVRSQERRIKLYSQDGKQFIDSTYTVRNPIQSWMKDFRNNPHAQRIINQNKRNQNQNGENYWFKPSPTDEYEWDLKPPNHPISDGKITNRFTDCKNANTNENPARYAPSHSGSVYHMRNPMELYLGKIPPLKYFQEHHPSYHNYGHLFHQYVRQNDQRSVEENYERPLHQNYENSAEDYPEGPYFEEDHQSHPMHHNNNNFGPNERFPFYHHPFWGQHGYAFHHNDKHYGETAPFHNENSAGERQRYQFKQNGGNFGESINHKFPILQNSEQKNLERQIHNDTNDSKDKTFEHSRIKQNIQDSDSIGEDQNGLKPSTVVYLNSGGAEVERGTKIKQNENHGDSRIQNSKQHAVDKNINYDNFRGRNPSHTYYQNFKQNYLFSPTGGFENFGDGVRFVSQNKLTKTKKFVEIERAPLSVASLPIRGTHEDAKDLEEFRENDEIDEEEINNHPFLLINDDDEPRVYFGNSSYNGESIMGEEYRNRLIDDIILRIQTTSTPSTLSAPEKSDNLPLSISSSTSASSNSLTATPIITQPQIGAQDGILKMTLFAPSSQVIDSINGDHHHQPPPFGPLLTKRKSKFKSILQKLFEPFQP